MQNTKALSTYEDANYYKDCSGKANNSKYPMGAALKRRKGGGLKADTADTHAERAAV